jgi:hypothetical protein
MEVVPLPSVTTFFTCIAVDALMGDSTSAAGDAKEGATQQ